MNDNTHIFLDTVFLLTLLFALTRSIYLRRKRTELLEKYKKLPHIQKQYMKITSYYRITILLAILVLVLAKSVMDISNALKSPETNDLLFTLTLGLIGFSIVTLLIFHLHKKFDLK